MYAVLHLVHRQQQQISPDKLNNDEKKLEKNDYEKMSIQAQNRILEKVHQQMTVILPCCSTLTP